MRTRNTFRRILRVLILGGICLSVAYVLSVGPVYKFTIIYGGGAVELERLDHFYRPIYSLAEMPLELFVSGYVQLWGLEFANTGNYSTPEPGEQIVWFIREPL